MTAVLSQVDRNCCGCDEEQGNIKIQSSILVSKMFLEVTGIKGKNQEIYLKFIETKIERNL